MLSLKNISKFYNTGGNKVAVLQNISLDINEGEFVSIMGPSGSGKSTLLNVIGMLDEPSEGYYYFMDQMVHQLKEKQRSALYKQYIGFVFQAYHLIDELTVYENIETPLLYQNVSSSERKALVADALDRFQIVGKKDLFPAQLSGGQQQLVGIARALIGKPKLLLADEPTGNLNSKQGEEIMELFRKLNKEDGVTIIQVTHSEKNAAYGSRIINLLDGKVDSSHHIYAMLSRKNILLICLMVMSAMAWAQQTTYTLPQCIDIAIKNNLSVSKSELQVQIAEIGLQQSRENLLPNLSGVVSHNVNSGRSVDPTSYTYVNRQITTANYGLNGGLTLFNGLAMQNSIKQASLAYQAGKMDFQQVKELVTLNVINAYLQVLNSEDQLVQANNQLVVSQKQVERLGILDKEGAAKPSDVYDVKGRLATDQLSLINAKNNLNQAKIVLLQIMNVPFDKSINIERFSATELQPYAVTTDAIYNTALHDIAIVKAATLRRESAEKGIKVAMGLLLPSISLSGGLYTNYSSGSEPIGYVNQFRNNYSTSFGLGLRIPILSAFQGRNRVSLAKINLLDAEYTERSTQIQLKQSIEQAYLNMTAAFERYQVLVEQIKAYTGSFNAAEAKFNAGVLNSVDFVLTKNNLDQANSALITARYDYLIRVKVLDYYQGKLAL